MYVPDKDALLHTDIYLKWINPKEVVCVDVLKLRLTVSQVDTSK